MIYVVFRCYRRVTAPGPEFPARLAASRPVPNRLRRRAGDRSRARAGGFALPKAAPRALFPVAAAAFAVPWLSMPYEFSPFVLQIRPQTAHPVSGDSPRDRVFPFIPAGTVRAFPGRAARSRPAPFSLRFDVANARPIPEEHRRRDASPSPPPPPASPRRSTARVLPHWNALPAGSAASRCDLPDNGTDVIGHPGPR